MQNCPECNAEQPRRADGAASGAESCAECGAALDPEKSNAQEKPGVKDQSAARSANRPPVPPAEDAQNRKNM